MSDLMAIAAAALPAAIEAGETEFAKGLAGLLGQVYGDTVSPGAKQLGLMIEDVVKTVRLLAWPLQMGAVFQDRFRRDLTAAMEKAPEGDRQVPPLKLFADCCEGSKFEDDPTLHEMWIQLLSRGCDRTRAGEAHPAFPGLLRQLAKDEAVIVQSLSIEPTLFVYGMEKGEDYFPSSESNIRRQFPYIQTPKMMNGYVEHLESLGLLMPLAGISQGTITKPPYEGWEEIAFELRLSTFGRIFKGAVTERQQRPASEQA